MRRWPEASGLQNHAGELSMLGFKYSRSIVFSDGAAVKYVHLSEHAGPPTTGDPDAPSRTAESLNMSLLSLIFFPDAGGAGRQTQTRPDQTFGERSGGRCGVSGQPFLASPPKQKGMKAGARLRLCGSCRAPLICSDDVY